MILLFDRVRHIVSKKHDQVKCTVVTLHNEPSLLHKKCLYHDHPFLTITKLSTAPSHPPHITRPSLHTHISKYYQPWALGNHDADSHHDTRDGYVWA